MRAFLLSLLVLISGTGQGIAEDNSAPATTAGEWEILVTENFRIYHRDAVLARKVARKCENARSQSLRFWFPIKRHEAWKPRCEVVLCEHSDDFAAEGRASIGGTGQASVVTIGSRILYRKIVLRTSDQALLSRTLPHEVTHVVVGSHFLNRKLPVWLDEGMATLSEPASERQKYLRRCRRNLPTLSKEVITTTDYPHPDRIPAFYAASHAVCDYLVRLDGNGTFLCFVDRLLKTDCEVALRDVYGLHCSDLQRAITAKLSEAN